MSKTTPDALIREIHAGPLRMVIAVTGGGSGAISALLGTGGASRTVLSAVVPYASQALTEWLGGEPDEFCSARTARAMAMAAYEKAKRFDLPGGADTGQSDSGRTVCGVACTASLASNRPKRGPHRAHVAYQTGKTTALLSVELEKGRRDRAEEEAVVADLVLNLIAEAGGHEGRIDLPLTIAEPVNTEQVVAPTPWQDLLAARTRTVPVGAARGTPGPQVVFPGAFDPLHVGHQKMAQVARAVLGQDVAYEMSIANVDKPPLDFIEISHRLGHFSAADAVWLTRAPLFSDKARLFPGATFVVGADTIRRIGQIRYYGGHQGAMEKAVSEIAAAGCRCLVFGRTIEGRFHTLGDLEIPASLAAICQEVPQEAFRDDISSTELRRQQA
jgi:hypothetical protein